MPDLCEMCRQVAETRPLAGLQVCPRCCQGELRDGLRAWGIKAYQNETKARHRSTLYFSTMATGPTVIEMNAVVRSRRHSDPFFVLGAWLRRRLGKPPTDPFRKEILIDPRGTMDESGGGMDDCVDPKEGDLTTRIVGAPTIQPALLEAARAAQRVHLHGQRLVLCSATGQPGVDLARIQLAAALLAIAVERWARGEPGGTLRSGCRERQPAEWPVWHNLAAELG